MSRQSVVTVPNFFSEAKKLRGFFDEQFVDVSRVHQKRFVWDHWYADEQYCHHRTPAYHYFPQKTYRHFHESLLSYGREVLGCYDITPPWLSYYTEGDFQNFHGDIPHGPWAFVYSLTNWKSRKFRGGETLIVQENILNFWNSFEHFKGLEVDDVIQKVPQHFNQLLVFDPRVPHGVAKVSGVNEPREGRLVIHGWFKNPEPYVVGGLTRKVAAHAVGDLLGEIGEVVQNYPVLHGTQSFRLSIARSGQVQGLKVLTDTLRLYDESLSKNLRREIQNTLKKFKFPRARLTSQLTLPIVYRF